MLSLKSAVSFLFVVIFIVNAEFECGIPDVQPILHPTGQRIVGGWEAKPHSFPWQTFLLIKQSESRSFACGGSLISFTRSNSTDLILSAAHCVLNDNDYASVDLLTVIVGAHDIDALENSQQVIAVKNYVLFDFKPKLKQDDLVLIQLKSEVPYTKYTRPVCLPKQGEEAEVGKKCYVAGWGIQSENGQRSSKLLLTDVEVYGIKECHIRTRRDQKYLCAGRKDGGNGMCTGDSGGPLVCENNDVWTQYGIVSYSVGCGLAGHPGVYVQVSNYVDRIKSEAKQLQAKAGGK